MTDVPDGVTTSIDATTASASTTVAAPAAAVFDYVRRPANHAAISGDATVKDAYDGPEVLGAGDRFGVKMRLGVPYRMHSTVKEFEADHLIAWCHLGGHRWRWEVSPVDDTRCTVTETFDLSTSRLPPVLRLIGYPGRHESNVARSVANVRDHFAGA